MVQQSLVKERGVWAVGGITASDIRNLLAEKHSLDVFVEECKNGETWGARDLLRLDAWVLKRTYSPLTTIGYEIKVSRQDFEQDQKWTGYLDLCHQFYFICPAGLIRAEDLPNQIGIIWASKGKKLYTKRKAKRVQPDIEKLNRLLIYVVMARSQIVANMYDRQEKPDKLQLWREEVERAEARKDLATFVRGHIRTAVEEARRINSSLQNRESDIKEFEERLAKLGIVWDSNSQNWMQKSQIYNEIQLLANQIDDNTLRSMENLSTSLQKTAATIRDYRSKQRLELAESSEADAIKQARKEVVDFIQKTDPKAATIFNYPASHTKLIEWGIHDPETEAFE